MDCFSGKSLSFLTPQEPLEVGRAVPGGNGDVRVVSEYPAAGLLLSVATHDASPPAEVLLLGRKAGINFYSKLWLV